jgi:hypothetical protein
MCFSKPSIASSLELPVFMVNLGQFADLTIFPGSFPLDCWSNQKQPLGTTAQPMCQGCILSRARLPARHEFFKGIIHFFVVLPSNWECQPTKVDPWNIWGASILNWKWLFWGSLKTTSPLIYDSEQT